MRFALVACLFLSTGCGILQPRPVSERVYTFNDHGQFVDVEYGNPDGMIAKALDAKRKLVSQIPDQIATQIPGLATPDRESTQQAANQTVDYLARNGLTDTKVRVNQYEPKEEWQRLRENDQIASPLRYTLGLLSIAKYSMVPGQLTQSDSYNPYTDTLHLNSGNSAIAIEQAAHAKDLNRRRMPGLYLLFKKIPGGDLPGIAFSKNEVVNYYAMYGTKGQLQEATDVMIPRLTSQIGGEVGEFLPGAGPAYSIAGKLIGKAIVSEPLKKLTR